jgi:hypothetical protein
MFSAGAARLVDLPSRIQCRLLASHLLKSEEQYSSVNLMQSVHPSSLVGRICKMNATISARSLSGFRPSFESAINLFGAVPRLQRSQTTQAGHFCHLRFSLSTNRSRHRDRPSGSLDPFCVRIHCGVHQRWIRTEFRDRWFEFSSLAIRFRRGTKIPPWTEPRGPRPGGIEWVAPARLQKRSRSRLDS